MFKYTVFFLLTILCTSLYGIDSFPMNELKFKKFFGQRTGDKNIYCLLGNGFFRTVSSNEEDVIIPNWLNKHPNAKAIPVSIVGEGSQMVLVYIWAIDGTESLNLNLIKNGAYPGSVMLDAVHFQALSKGSPDQENIKAGIAYARKLNPNLPVPKETPPRRLIPDSNYDNFLKDLKNAQNMAQIQKNGIWSDKFANLREGFNYRENNKTSAEMQKNLFQNDNFRKILAKDITYPTEARRNHQEGEVIVSFTLLSSGEVTDLVIVKSSGFKLLDDESLALIKRNAPNLPKSVTRHFSIPISYKLK